MRPPELAGEPWAIAPEIFSRLGEPGFAPVALRLRAATKRGPRLGQNGLVSVIPIFGVITHRESFRQRIFGGTSIERLTAQFRQALADPAVRVILFDVDSPGGEAAGTPELADEIFRSRSKKKTVAVANCEASSGAFWLASAASELVVAPSGMVGSIGVVAAHTDCSAALEKEGVRISFIKAGKFKTDGNPFEPLAASARADLQGKVDTFHDKFVSDVARGRGVQKSTVRGRFGEGRSVLARQAVAAGMADRVATLDQTLRDLISGRDEDSQSSLALARFRLSLLGQSPDSGAYWEEQREDLRRSHAS